MDKQIEPLVFPVLRWAGKHSAIRAVSLVGSWARGTAQRDSDIDLMFLAEQPLFFNRDNVWLCEIDWHSWRIQQWQDRRYGVVWSRHVQLKDQEDNRIEIEFSFGALSWASVEPIDAGTRRVVDDGCQVLYDPEGTMLNLIAALQA